MANFRNPPNTLQTSPHHAAPLVWLRGWWTSLDRTQRGLMFLMVARWVVATVFMLNLLPLDLRYKWYLHHGGDQQIFMRMAESIIAGQPRSERVGIGQALVMLPWVALIKPHHYFDIVAPLVIINGYILGGLSVLVVGSIARRVTQDDRIALWSAALWALLPLFSYYSFFWHFDPVNVRSSTVPTVGWLNGLSDGPAAFALLIAILLLAKASRQDGDPSFWQMAGVGAATGTAVIFRIHFAPATALIVLYVLLVYGWCSFLTVCGAGLIVYIPQGWYNQVVFGLPITTGYISDLDMQNWGGTLNRPLSDIITGLPFSPGHIIQLGKYYIGRRPWLIIPLAGLGMIGAYVLAAIWRQRGWQSVMLLIGIPLSYLGPMAFAWPFRDAILRFSMPVFPFVIIMCVYAARTLWASLGRLKHTTIPPSP